MSNAPHQDVIGEDVTDHGGLGATFVDLRVVLQQHIRDFKEAYEQGLALDMAFAADNLDDAAIALAMNVRNLLTRKGRIEMQIRTALYECHALDEVIRELFEACLLRSRAGDCLPLPQDASPVESYPWLRERLACHLSRIHHVLSRCNNEHFTEAVREVDHG